MKPLWIALGALSVLGRLTLADAPDHQTARDGVLEGRFVRLSDILRNVERDFGAALIDARLERVESIWVYEVFVMGRAGAVLALEYDAASGALRSVRRGDEVGAERGGDKPSGQPDATGRAGAEGAGRAGATGTDGRPGGPAGAGRGDQGDPDRGPAGGGPGGGGPSGGGHGGGPGGGGPGGGGPGGGRGEGGGRGGDGPGGGGGGGGRR